MAVDVSGLAFLMPLFTAIFSFILIYVILNKSTIIGESKAVQLIMSAILTIALISVDSIRQLIEEIMPWIAVLAIIIFFIAFIASFPESKLSDVFTSKFLWIIVGILAVIILISGVKTFGSNIGPYLPGQEEPTGVGGAIKKFLYSPKVVGTLLLLIVGAVVAWVIASGGSGGDKGSKGKK
jgi:hypothetical protein